jgi:four helix bundle protein
MGVPMPFLFEKLVVYQKSLDFVDKVSRLTENYHKGTFYLADQLNRAALSIPTNIAEGNGRWTTKDKNHFFLIARGSAFECVPLLEVSRRRGLVGADIQAELKSTIDEIGAMLTGLMK